VRCDLDDEIGVQCGGDPVRERDGRNDAAGFDTGQRGLGHAGSGRNLDLGQTECEAAFADATAEQVGALGFSPALAVFVAVAAV
jgi:hypothetical protein